MGVQSISWRVCFVVSALFILTGGPQHPGGTMAEMLAHPAWVPSHSLLLAGFALLPIGLVLYQRAGQRPARTRRWTRIALIGALLQAVEMAFHLASYVDHANLMAGRATPVLTTHLWLAAVCYPIFGVTIAGWIVAGTRDKVLGSPWIAWIGILGALAHGAAAPLVVTFGIQGAAVLFPLLVLFALWLALAGLWPARRTA
jgi:hypothetical protein